MAATETPHPLAGGISIVIMIVNRKFNIDLKNQRQEACSQIKQIINEKEMSITK